MSGAPSDDRAREHAEERIAETASDLLGYLVRRVDSRDEAVELLAETLAAVWRGAARLPADPTRARMWMFGVARNVLRRHRRDHRSRTALHERLAASLPASPWAHDDAVAVRWAVDRLPPGLAELVRLVHWDGCTLEEAARILRIPASTARSRHVRAKELLRRALAHDDASGAPAAEPARR